MNEYDNTEEMDPETLRAVIEEDKLNQREAAKWYRRNTEGAKGRGKGPLSQALGDALSEVGEPHDKR